MHAIDASVVSGAQNTESREREVHGLHKAGADNSGVVSAVFHASDDFGHVVVREVLATEKVLGIETPAREFSQGGLPSGKAFFMVRGDRLSSQVFDRLNRTVVSNEKDGALGKIGIRNATGGGGR